MPWSLERPRAKERNGSDNVLEKSTQSTVNTPTDKPLQRYDNTNNRYLDIKYVSERSGNSWISERKISGYPSAPDLSQHKLSSNCMLLTLVFSNSDWTFACCITKRFSVPETYKLLIYILDNISYKTTLNYYGEIFNILCRNI